MRIGNLTFRATALGLLAAMAPSLAAAATCLQTTFQGAGSIANIQNDIYFLDGPPITFDGVGPNYLGEVPNEAFLEISSGACQLDFAQILIDDDLRPQGERTPPSSRLYKTFFFEIPVDDEFDTLAYVDGEVLRLEILSDGGEYPTAADFDPIFGLGEFVGFGAAEVRLSRAADLLAPLAPIPLPAGAGLLGMALGGLVLGARRRRRLS